LAGFRSVPLEDFYPIRRCRGGQQVFQVLQAWYGWTGRFMVLLDFGGVRCPQLGWGLRTSREEGVLPWTGPGNPLGNFPFRVKDPLSGPHGSGPHSLGGGLSWGFSHSFGPLPLSWSSPWACPN